ncbi:hypothetical protein [Nocardioides marmoraquaticus]
MTALPRSRPLTRALVVTPAPGERHQTVVGELYLRLRAACLDDLEVLLAPFDVALADDTVMQPDLVVCRRRDLTLKESRFEAAGCALLGGRPGHAERDGVGSCATRRTSSGPR